VLSLLFAVVLVELVEFVTFALLIDDKLAYFTDNKASFSLLAPYKTLSSIFRQDIMLLTAASLRLYKAKL